MKKVLYSNLQKDILSFYRSALKWAATRGENRKAFELYAYNEFRKNMNLKRNNFDMIEHKYHKGRSTFLYMQNANITKINMY